MKSAVVSINEDVTKAIKIVHSKDKQLAVKLVGQISGFDSNQAQDYIDFFVLERTSLCNAIINGSNKLVNGSTRYWVNVKATKERRKGKNGKEQILVIDPYSDYETRWLSMSSFTGTVTLVNNESVQWKNGKEINKGQDDYNKKIFSHERVRDFQSGTPVQSGTISIKSGNGHKKEKIRKLRNWEKNIIRYEFVKRNGEISSDTCLEIKKKLAKQTAIFQVTGFVSLLHKYVLKGKLSLSSLEHYYYFQYLKKNGERDYQIEQSGA